MKLLVLDEVEPKPEEDSTETELSFKDDENYYNDVWPINWNSDGNISLDQQSIKSFASSSGEAPSEWVFGSPKQDEFLLEDDLVYRRLTKKCSDPELCNDFAGLNLNEDDKHNKPSGTYAETDLDLPTNYSLRYADDDSDVDDLSKGEIEYVGDTVKAYCTEGTPYETPFNYSNSTSMSDLRIEKPINYCEEGTPGYFSRISSCGSLNSVGKEEAEKKEVKLPSPNEGTKAVTFAVNYAEQTPLMFSRSSSLASLDSIEEAHSIHDDRSSIISDFSRLPSGIISPSELPDSPTQTVPQSPKEFRGNNFDFASTSRNVFAESGRNSLQKHSVFEDNVTKFKEESTPLQFSTATSISDLTIDDEPFGNDPKDATSLQSIKESKLEQFSNEDENDRFTELASKPPVCIYSDNIRNYYTEDTPAILSHAGSQSDLSVLSMKTDNKSGLDFLSDLSDDEAGNALLAQCIQSGMPKAKPKKAFVNHVSNSSEKKFQFLEAKDEMSYFGVENSPCPYSLRSSLSDLTVDGSDVGLVRSLGDGESDHSPLSPLSNDSFSLEAEQAMLEQCINSGMPKRRIIVNDARVEERLEPAGRLQSIAEDLEKDDSFEELSDNEEEALLANCIRLGMQRQTKGNDCKGQKSDNVELLSNDDEEAEEDILQRCIQVGMMKKLKSPAKRFNYPRLQDTPRIKLNADNSDISVDFNESLLENCIKSGMPKPKLANKQEDEFNSSGEFDEDLLAQCIKSGMPKKAKSKDEEEVLTIEDEDDDEFNEALLAECIKSGMPKAKPKPEENPSVDLPIQVELKTTVTDVKCVDDLDSSGEFNEALLAECIKSGMPKPKLIDSPLLQKEFESQTNKEQELDSSGEYNENLLAECIKSGMPKAKVKLEQTANNVNFPLTEFEPKYTQEFKELDSSEEFDVHLLAECIKSGMPKSKLKTDETVAVVDFREPMAKEKAEQTASEKCAGAKAKGNLSNAPDLGEEKCTLVMECANKIETSKDHDEARMIVEGGKAKETKREPSTQFSLKSKLKALRSKVTLRIRHNLKISNRKG